MRRTTTRDVSRPKMSKLAIRSIAVCLTLTVLVVSCGGNNEPGLGDLIEAAGGDDDAGGTINAGGIEVDTDDNNVTASAGGVSVGLGTDLDRPDWLDDWVQLPPGLAISLAVNDESTGELAIQGIVAATDAETVKAQQRAMLEAQGYEALQDSGFYVQPGRQPIKVEAGDIGDGSVGYFFEHSFESEQTLRDRYAAVEGRGTLTAWINNQVLTFEGSCSLRSTSGQFGSDDATANLTIEERDGEQDYILGNITITEGDFELWTVLQVTAEGEYPAVSIRPDGFQFDGFMVDSSLSNPTGATLEVICPG